MQQALQTVSQALTQLKEHKTVTWLLDSGFDDVAVWRTIWEQQEHLVARIYHTDRTVAFQDRQGAWHQGDIAQATAHLRPLARVETTLVVKRGKQVRPKKQPVPVDLAARPLRVSYWTNVRRKGQGKLVTREVWLVQVRVLGVDWEPLLLLTDWPVRDQDMRTEFEDFCTWVFVGVDDIWEQIAPFFKRPGPAPVCSDSELIPWR